MWDKYKKLSASLENAKYEIRGPLHSKAMQLEAEGKKILKLNIGNPAAFGFKVPEVLTDKLLDATLNHHGYCESKGQLEARKAIVQYNQEQGIPAKSTDDVYIGNGVSELILLVTRVLVGQEDDEILVPSPNYPLWTSAVTLAGGKAVHYRCDEENNWNPNLEDIRSKVTDKTKAIVVINPNNPTGAVYSKEVLLELCQIAREKEIMILSDEIYERITYDDAKHIPIASLAEDLLCITFNGLSKANLLCGYRIGWAQLTGPFEQAPGFKAGLDQLTSMRLCSVSPFQALIKDCLFNDHGIDALTAPGGRLYQQNKIFHEKINAIEGLSVSPSYGALYGFPKIDLEKFDFEDDLDFVTKLLVEEQVLVVSGQGFNWPNKDHFRVAFLPDVETLSQACDRIAALCERYRIK